MLNFFSFSKITFQSQTFFTFCQTFLLFVKLFLLFFQIFLKNYPPKSVILILKKNNLCEAPLTKTLRTNISSQKVMALGKDKLFFDRSLKFFDLFQKLLS